MSLIADQHVLAIRDFHSRMGKREKLSIAILLPTTLTFIAFTLPSTCLIAP